MWLLLADLHVRGELLQSTDRTIRWIKELFSNEKPSHVFLLGDTFHFRDKLGVETLCAVRELLQHFLDADQACTIHILVGNHDMCDVVNREPNSISVFGLHARIQCYSEITSTTIDGREILFIPFHNDHKEVMQYLDSFEGPRSKTVVFAHLALLGAIHHGRHRCFKDGIAPSYFDDFSHTFMGHFHKHSVYGESSNIVYVGSPVQHSWNEATDLRKGAILYDPLTGEWNLRVNPHAHRFIRVSMREARADMQSPSTDISKYKEKHVRLFQDGDDDFDDAAQIIKHLETAAGASNAVFTAAAAKTEPSSPSERQGNSEGPFNALKHAEAFIQNEHDAGKVGDDKRDALLAYIRALDGRLESSSNPAASKATFACDVHDMSIENFLGVKDSVRFAFRDWAKGVYLVHGHNGAGKSTIMEALYWAVYGDSLRGLKLKDDIINTKGKRCIVRVAFSNGYVVTRERHKNTESLVVRDPSGTSHRKVDGASLIQQFMHFDKTEFLRISMLDSRQIHAITSTDPKKRKAIYCKLLGFGLLDTYLKEIEADRAEARKTVTVLTMSLCTAETSARAARDRLGEAMDRISLKTRELEESSEAQRVLVEQLTACKQVIESQLDSRNAALLRQTMLYQKSMDIKDALQRAQMSVAEATNAAAAFLRSASHAHILSLHESLNKYQDQLRVRIQDQKGYEQAKHFAMENVRQARRDEHRHHESISELKKLIQEHTTSHARLGQCSERIYLLQSEKLELERKKEDLQRTHKEMLFAREHGALREPIEHILKVVDESINEMVEAADDARAERWRQHVYDPLDALVPKRPESEASDSLEQLQADIQATNRQLVGVIEELFVLRIELDEISRSDARFVADNVETRLQDSKTRALSAKSIANTQLKHLSSLSGLCTSAMSDIAVLNVLIDRSRGDIKAAQKDGHLLDTETMAQLDTLRRAVSDAEAIRIETTKRLASTAEDLKDADAALKQMETYAGNCDVRLREVSQKVAALDSKVDYIRQSLNEDKSTLEILKDSSHELDKTHNLAENARSAAVNHLAVIDAWHLFLAKEGTFRTYCLEQSATDINVRLGRNMALLCQDDNHDPTGNDISCMLDIKTLELVATGSGLAMAKRSDGQRRRSHLALFFAYFQAAQSHSAFRPKWLFLDEVFDALDNDGQHAVLRWIADYASINRDVFIFVVSHSAAVHSLSNKVFAGQLLVRWDKTNESSHYTLVTSDRPGWEVMEDDDENVI